MKSILVICTLIFSLSGYASTPMLPSSWLTPSMDKADSNQLEMPAESVDLEIDNLFSQQHRILKNMDKNSTKKWKVTDYVFMLALSKSGLLGFKALNGKSVFQVYYQKKKDKELVAPQAEQADLYVYDQMSDSELSDQISPLISGLVDAGKIEANSELQNQIIAKIHELKKVVGNLESSNQHKFYLDSFRFDLGINRSGILIPGWIAQKGTEVILRLQWGRMMKKGAIAQNEKSFNSTRFEKFTNAVLSDLDKIDESPLAQTGKKAVKIRIGMGVTTSQQIVISNSKTSFSGHLIFKRNPKFKPTQKLLTSHSTYGLDKSGELTTIDSSQFIKGLNKAVKMGSYFVRKADKSKKWKVSLLRAWYIIDKTGFLGLAPITGTSEIEFFYK